MTRGDSEKRLRDGQLYFDDTVLEDKKYAFRKYIMFNKSYKVLTVTTFFFILALNKLLKAISSSLYNYSNHLQKVKQFFASIYALKSKRMIFRKSFKTFLFKKVVKAFRFSFFI